MWGGVGVGGRGMILTAGADSIHREHWQLAS